jgi:hypothetical protein
LDSKPCTYTADSEPRSNIELSKFREFTIEEIRGIIANLSSASCQLDPITTPLLKQCVNPLLDILTKIVNMSLKSGVFPHCLKHALVRPTLKKPNLDTENLKNYRPVSNIATLSKIIEKAAVTRLSQHMDTGEMHEQFQSAYRPGYSTETALIRITNDILSDMDNKRCVILVMLDLSAAFDTLDYDVLLSRIHSRLGISDTALKWFRGYHSGRTQSVVIGDSKSSPVVLESGAPQGSVIGAEDYKMYTLPVGDIIQNYGLKYSIYADDSQKWTSFCIDHPDEVSQAINRIRDCVLELKSWMTLIKLQLNEEKQRFYCLNQTKLKVLP